MLSEEYEELLSFKKPTLKQNKIDYKANIAAALALKNIKIEEPEAEDNAEQQELDDDKTVLMVKKPKPPQIENKTEPKKADMKITSDDEEIDPDKTVLMAREPKK